MVWDDLMLAAETDRADSQAMVVLSGLQSVEYLMSGSFVQVTLIRPGATLYDEQNRVQGILDIPLSDRGRAEAARLAESLASRQDSYPLSALYCGPGESVVRTAEIVGKALGLRPRRIDELRNLNQGLWQGLQIEEIKRRNTKLFRQWMEDPRTICPPQGEPVVDAIDRVKTAFKPLLRRHQDGDSFALVVGEPLARLIAFILKRGSRPQLDERLSCCGFERIDIPPDWLASGFS
jgi:broad specificity phosphatase PhoE